MLNKITFSIVIPAYNGEQFIQAALDSALDQTRSADEIIVIDDASTDGTGKILQEAARNGRIQYFQHEKPSGFVDAWNRAIAAATGDFVTILHQDDLLDPEYLAQVAQALKQYPHVRHVFAACRYIDAGGRIVGHQQEHASPEPVLYSGREYAHYYLHSVIANRHIHRCPGVTTERRLLLEQCSYRKEAGHIADDDFFLRVGNFTDVAGISQPLASFRIHRGSETSRLDLLSLRLARDYLFQVKWYQQEQGLLDKTDIQVINRLAVRFVNLLLFQALLHGNVEWQQEALRLRDELARLIPGFIDTALPVWAGPMWYLTGASAGTAKAYVRLLHGIISTRDLLRGKRPR